MKYIFVKMTIILLASIVNTSYAEPWACDNGQDIDVEYHDQYITINNKNKQLHHLTENATYQGDCTNCGQFGRGNGKIYSNNQYTYTISFDNEIAHMYIQNKLGKSLTCGDI
jgi:hypothetical protein